MWQDRFEKVERFPGHPEAGHEYRLASDSTAGQMGGRGMLVEIAPAMSGHDRPDVWDIRVHGPGSMTIQNIRTLDKALRVGGYLYDELLAEVEAENARRDEESDRRHAEWEAARPKREAEQRAREKKIAKLPVVEAFKCGECGHIEEDRDEFGVPGYECSRCSSHGRGEDGRRCDVDHIFRAKVADESCPSCEEPLPEGPEPVKAKNLDGAMVEADA